MVVVRNGHVNSCQITLKWYPLSSQYFCAKLNFVGVNPEFVDVPPEFCADSSFTLFKTAAYPWDVDAAARRARVS